MKTLCFLIILAFANGKWAETAINVDKVEYVRPAASSELYLGMSSGETFKVYGSMEELLVRFDRCYLTDTQKDALLEQDLWEPLEEVK